MPPAGDILDVLYEYRVKKTSKNLCFWKHNSTATFVTVLCMRACGLQAQELNEQAEYEASDDIVAKPANHWMINDLVLFVDSEDVPRIPKQLFDEVTQIRVDGVPGPVYLGHLEALRQLFRIVLFIGFVFIIVLSFGAVYKVSSTNQTAAVVVGGFLPMILRMFLAPPPPNVEMGTVSFKSKMDEVIKNFSQYWPIHDMPFELIPGDEEAAEGNEEASASGEGNHPAGLDGCPNNNSVYVEGNGTARIVCGAGLYQGRIQEFALGGTFPLPSFPLPYRPPVGGSVAEWLACWARVQKGPGSNRSRDAVG